MNLAGATIRGAGKFTLAGSSRLHDATQAARMRNRTRTARAYGSVGESIRAATGNQRHRTTSS